MMLCRNRFLVLGLVSSLTWFLIACAEIGGQAVTPPNTIDEEPVQYHAVVISPIAKPTSLSSTPLTPDVLVAQPTSSPQPDFSTHPLIPEVAIGYPTLSPDGKTIAFVAPLTAQISEEVYLIDLVRNERFPIFNEPLAHTDGPFKPAIWSPDSRYFLFLDQNSDIHVVKRDTHEHIEIPYYGRSSTWSPDSKRILFVRWKPRQRQSVIAVIDADGQNYTELTTSTSGLRYATWSPDGSHIAFIAHQFGDKDMWGQPSPSAAGELMVMNSNGQQLKQLTNLNQPIGRPTWSNDGLEIIFPIIEYQTVQAIYIINRDGTNLRLRPLDD